MHQRNQSRVEQTSRGIIEIGKLLEQAKDEFGHGRFTDIFKRGSCCSSIGTAETSDGDCQTPDSVRPAHMLNSATAWGTLLSDGRRYRGRPAGSNFWKMARSMPIPNGKRSKKSSRIEESHRLRTRTGSHRRAIQFMKKYPEPVRAGHLGGLDYGFIRPKRDKVRLLAG